MANVIQEGIASSRGQLLHIDPNHERFFPIQKNFQSILGIKYVVRVPKTVALDQVDDTGVLLPLK